MRAGNYPKGAAKREEILAGVIEMLAKAPYFKLTLKVIGETLGVNPAHILYYFSSREDLFQQVILHWDRDPLVTPSKQAPERSPLDLLVASVKRNLQLPGLLHLYHALAAEAIDPGHPSHAFFRERFQNLRQALSKAIQREQAAGTIAPDIDPNRSARELIALADGLQLQSLVDSSVDVVADIAAAVARLRI